METETSEASTTSTAQDGLLNVSSQTSRQWSDEVAEQDEKTLKKPVVAGRP
jgi:hypothetical protein